MKQRPPATRLFTLILTGSALTLCSAHAQNTTTLQNVRVQLPNPLQLRLQTLPTFGSTPIFKPLDAAASARFLNGNTIWLTAAGLEANRQARVQNLNINLSRLQPQAARPQVQAVLNAVKLQGLTEPSLTVDTKSGPQQVKLLSADVGAALLARDLSRNVRMNSDAFQAEFAQAIQADQAYVKRFAQTPNDQRVAVSNTILAELTRARPAVILAPQEPAGTGNGLDVVPNSCPPSNTGLFVRYDFPMKKNLPVVKNQGGRGTCWAFATVGMAETLIQSKFNKRVNLSEEDYVAYSKLKYGAPDDGDGADTHWVMQQNAQNAYRFVFENVWEYNQSLQRTETETAKDSGKYIYTKSCLNYPYQNQCEDSVSQAETGCIIADGKTVCGGQLPNSRTTYGLNTTYLTNKWDWNDREGSLGWAVLALHFGTPVLLVHDARYLQGDARAFVGDLPYNAAGHSEEMNGIKKWVLNTEKDVQSWNHIALLVGFIDNTKLKQLMPDAPAAPGGGYFIMKNSWGTCWGDGGYIYLSWDWMKKYAGGLLMGARITN